jgi:putative endonuclease
VSFGRVAELADAPDLGSGTVRCAGSSPVSPTTPFGVASQHDKIQMFTTYILFSERLNQHYTGHTKDFPARLLCHNQGGANHTSKGVPWIVMFTKEYSTRKEAAGLERHIKRIGVNVFLKSEELSAGLHLPA